jgi:choline-sulfatase
VEIIRMKDMTRRTFLKAGAATLGAASVAGRATPVHAAAKPNVLFIICDQLGLDAIAAHGFRDAVTPNIDRLVGSGTTFMESHSTNPVCSPARSSLLTGRMPIETGVPVNGRPIHASCPNVGQWFGQNGYETVYCGKWHLPAGYASKLPGFVVLPAGRTSREQGDMIDTVVSRACESYLKTRRGGKPFLLVASLLQPHDICYYANAMPGVCRVPEKLPFPEIADELPELPPNHDARPAAPAGLDRTRFDRFTSDDQWRYYLYIYARMVEMLDADIGRILDALDASGEARNTIVVFTSDHGDGRGRHRHVSKWYPYEEAVKVPLVVSWPGHVAERHRDGDHLVSGLDIMSTLCDYAGIKAPAGMKGRSLRPLLERRKVVWREFVASEFRQRGMVIRTDRYKYVHFQGDPVEQLFDMKKDPWETKNLYQEPRLAGTLEDHRKLLKEWNSIIRPPA